MNRCDANGFDFSRVALKEFDGSVRIINQ